VTLIRHLSAAGLLVAIIGAASVAHADTLDSVRAAGVVRCGSNGASEDYTRADTHGDITDLADAVCKAVAVAVLGRSGKAAVHVWPDERRMLDSLRDGTSDLAIGVAPTLATQFAFHVGFAPPVFYDGQGLLVRNDIGSVEGLAGKQICFVNDGTLDETLRAGMHARHVDYIPFPFEEVGEMLSAAAGSRCAAVTGDLSQLINLRFGLASIDKRFHLLPDTFSIDPVAPTYRDDSPRWGMVVGAVVNALIQAEQSGVTAANAAQLQTSDDPVIQGLIGPRSVGPGRLLGLPDHWALTMLQGAGNYGEMFGRTLGQKSDFGLPRGANRPWSQGGAMSPLPLY